MRDGEQESDEARGTILCSAAHPSDLLLSSPALPVHPPVRLVEMAE